MSKDVKKLRFKLHEAGKGRKIRKGKSDYIRNNSFKKEEREKFAEEWG